MDILHTVPKKPNKPGNHGKWMASPSSQPRPPFSGEPWKFYAKEQHLLTAYSQDGSPAPRPSRRRQWWWQRTSIWSQCENKTWSCSHKRFEANLQHGTGKEKNPTSTFNLIFKKIKRLVFSYNFLGMNSPLFSP